MFLHHMTLIYHVGKLKQVILEGVRWKVLSSWGDEQLKATASEQLEEVSVKHLLCTASCYDLFNGNISEEWWTDQVRE